MNPHLSTPVLRAGAAAEKARAAAILLHGRSRTPQEMLALAARLDLPRLAWLAPAAADASWYPLGFLAPPEENEPRFSQACERIESLVTELADDGIPRERVALVGFSQGACLLCEHAHRSGGRWGALVAFTGGVFGPEGTTWAPTASLEGTPMLLTGSDGDTWVPVARVRETHRVLGAMGARGECFTYSGDAHVVTDPELARARTLLGRMEGHG